MGLFLCLSVGLSISSSVGTVASKRNNISMPDLVESKQIERKSNELLCCIGQGGEDGVSVEIVEKTDIFTFYGFSMSRLLSIK